MNFRIPVTYLTFLCAFFLVCFANIAERNEDPIVKLEPYVVEAKSLVQTGFTFIAKFRHHLIWAGIKELVITEVEARSAAKKAGLQVGDKIIQVWDVKVEGLKIKELQELCERKTKDGKIPLVVQSKDSKSTRNVKLQWSDPVESQQGQVKGDSGQN